MAWTSDELDRLGREPELRIAGRREDGGLRSLVIIWAVVVDDQVYVRSVRGVDGGWYRGVRDRHEGRIESGGVEADVRFTDIPADDPVQDRIDEAYRAKYPSSGSSVTAINAPAARAAALRVDRA